MDLQTLRSRLRSLIAQTDSSNSDYTDPDLNGFLNDAVRFVVSQTKYARDLIEVQVELNKDTYTLPNDNMIICAAFFGDRNTAGDVKKIDIYTPEVFFDQVPGWLDATSGTSGRPTRLFLINRQNVFLNPRPDAGNSATGKKLYLYYVYYPTSMASETDAPDLAVGLHDILPLYAAHLCYLGKLKNKDIADTFYKRVLENLKLLEQPTTKEIENQSFSFQGRAETDDYGIIP